MNSSKIYKTGELIDQLQTGEEAECVSGVHKGKVIYKTDVGSIKLKLDEHYVTLTKSVMNSLWMIRGKYITFEKAVNELINGNPIQSYLDGMVYDTYKSLDELHRIEEQEIKEMQWTTVKES